MMQEVSMQLLVTKYQEKDINHNNIILIVNLSF
jgi:hypothetical protein